jgi:TetR/AcrR family transcriptional repressor of nem operon
VDAARAGGGLSEVFAEGIERNIQRFAQLLVDSRAEAGSATVRSQDRERAIQVLATMVGGLVLARATAAAQPALSDELLTTLQTQLIGLLGEEPR